MRHLLANVVTYGIAALLFTGAALFAQLRSSQLTLTDRAAVLAAWEPSPGSGFRWRALGAATYRRDCSNCHGRDGLGWDQYPPVVGVAPLLRVPDGRERLVDVVLHGRSTEGARVPMPAMGHLHDAEVAAVLNHVATTWGVADPADLFTPDEVAQRRE